MFKTVFCHILYLLLKCIYYFYFATGFECVIFIRNYGRETFDTKFWSLIAIVLKLFLLFTPFLKQINKKILPTCIESKKQLPYFWYLRFELNVLKYTKLKCVIPVCRILTTFINVAFECDLQKVSQLLPFIYDKLFLQTNLATFL